MQTCTSEIKFKTVKDLGNQIDREISPFMRSNCVLLDTPDHLNTGDQLIFQGEVDYLDSKDISPEYTCSIHTFDWREFDPDTLILLHGGGNFGDVWNDHQIFRMKVLETYPDNEIFVFPQSVQYSSEDRLRSDSQAFSRHANVTICARDQYSFDLLNTHFENRILLVPDMAFSSQYRAGDALKKESLLMKRNDREISHSIEYSQYSDRFEIYDWPTFDHTLEGFLNRIRTRVNRNLSSLSYRNKKGATGDVTFGLGLGKDRVQLVREGVKFIGRYQFVVTTRLHGHILSLLMGIPSVMIDNSYGKNSRFYDTWLRDIPTSNLVSSESELNSALDQIEF